jgi:hypothetical protein
MYNEMMSPPAPTLTALGSRAWQLWAQSCSASVWGSTSQGIFLHLPPRGVIFLSFEPYHGPLTANLGGDGSRLRSVTKAEEVQIDDGCLCFPGAGVRLDGRGASIWNVPPLPQVPFKIEDALERYQEVHRLVTALRRDEASLLFSRQFDQSERLTGDELLPILLPQLGRGMGLTPAADDVILGCLLTLNRWGDRLAPNWDARTLNQGLVSAAWQKTALLSANLIECAAEGQADERLVLALDGILTGQLSAERCAHLLLSWGHSSGCEALAGMGIGLRCLYLERLE